MNIKRLRDLGLGQDPILSNLARGVSQEEFIGERLLPVFRVDSSKGKIPVYGATGMKVYDSQRPLKSPNAPKIDADAISLDDFSLDEFALGADIDYLEKASTFSSLMDLEASYVMEIQESMNLKKEVTRVTVLQDSATYLPDHVDTLAGSDMWTNPDSDPVKQIRDACELIQSKILKMPNKLALSPQAYNALTVHPKILEQIKYSGKIMVTDEVLTELFSTKNQRIEIMVGSGVMQDGITDAFHKLWDNTAVLAYVTDTAAANRSRRLSTLGYTLQMKGFPWSAKINSPNGVITTIENFDMYEIKVIDNKCGFLFKNITA